VTLRVMGTNPETIVFEYGVMLRGYRTLTFALAQTPAQERRARHWLAEAWCSSTGERYNVLGLDRDAMIDELLTHYSRWLNALNECETTELPETADG